ncbi:MAG: glycosyltransferase, partial [Pseudomonadota bacterium]
MSISVIIPVHDDTAACTRLLTQLRSVWGISEVIVSASRIDAELQQICMQFDARLIEADQGRGIQLNAGARLATHSILWFLHADATPDVDAGR